MEPSSISNELWAQVCMKQGDHCLRNSEHKTAAENYRASLNYDANKLDAVYRLAREFTHAGTLQEAFRELSAVDHETHFKCNLQKCDCLYEDNTFEKNILALSEQRATLKSAENHIPHSNKRINAHLADALQNSPKMSEIKRRFDTVIANYADTIGAKAGNCIHDHRKYFDKVYSSWRRLGREINTTPLVLRKQDLCLPLPVTNEEEKTAREKHRGKLLRRMLAQSYMHSAWQDFDFLASLREDKTLKASTQNAETYRKVTEAIDECNAATNVMIRQLHARCPLYSKRHQATLNPTRAKHQKALRLCRLRNDIAYKMFSSLSTLAECRVGGDLRRLLRNAERELTTRQRMYPVHLTPRRDEFVADICNYVALGYIDDLVAKLSHIDKSLDDRALLRLIFGVDFLKSDAAVEYRFGDQSTYREAVSEASAPGKDKTRYFKQRMLQKPMTKIELCYLQHELAWEQLRQMQMEDARTSGKAIERMAEGVSHLWILLGRIMMCRGDVLQGNFEKTQRRLNAILDSTHIFKCDKLEEILDVAMEVS